MTASTPPVSPEDGCFGPEYVIRETPDYRLTFENKPISESDHAVYVHFDVFRWSASLLRQMLAEWKYIRAQIDAPLFAVNPDDDPKWPKFIEKFGFSYLRDIVGTDGAVRPLYVHLGDSDGWQK